MTNRIIKFLLLAAVVWFTASFFSGVSVASYTDALIAAVVLSLINTFIKPIVSTIAIPLSVLTLGLFSFVVSALMVLLMDYFVGGFTLAAWWWAFPFSLIISFANSTIDTVVG